MAWLPQPIKREVTQQNIISVANMKSSGKWVAGQLMGRLLRKPLIHRSAK